MQVESFFLERLQIPLKIKFSQSNNTTKVSDSMILRVKTAAGILGLGEACPRLYVSGESPESMEIDLARISNLLLHWEFPTLPAIKQFVLNILPAKVGPSTICAVELALLDAWCKEQQVPISQLFDIDSHKTLNYSGVIPMRSLEEFPKIMPRIEAMEFKSLKLKVGTELNDSLQKIKYIQTNYPREVSIRIDANTSWDLETAMEQIPEFLKLGVNQFEQVFPKGKEKELAQLTKQFGHQARISVDESFTDLRSLKSLLRLKACNHFNFKISKVGGIFHALEAYALIKSHGHEAQLGAHFGETSILTRAGMIFALLVKDLTALEGAYGELLLEKDLIKPSFTINRKAQLNASMLLRPFCQRRIRKPAEHKNLNAPITI